MQISQFNYTELEAHLAWLKPYCQLRDYKYFFSSREWISAYIRFYKPEVNYLFTEGSNYFVLSGSDGRFSFCGNDLNDYNGIDNVDSHCKFDKTAVLNKLLELECPVIITQVFETDFNDCLNKNAIKLKPTECVAVTPEAGQSFQRLISKRIQKMYLDHQFSFSYSRYFLDGAAVDMKKLLSNMILLRQSKLLARYRHEFNSSLLNEFIMLIMSLASETSLVNNMFIDISYRSGDPVGLTVNFLYKKTVMNYLRCFIKTDQTLSNGLMLDYWASMTNDSNEMVKLDFTRGAEPYKHRLGGKSYSLNNFKLNDDGK